MSNGSGPIIIQRLIEAPGSTEVERADLRKILERYEAEHRCSRLDALRVVRIVWRLIR